MSSQAQNDVGSGRGEPQLVEKITVRLRVGTDRMAASVDPVFLRLGGPDGRDFRLQHHHGKGLRKGREEIFVLGPPDSPDTNIVHPELNDPTTPSLDLRGIHSVKLIKGLEPLPNVRGVGEMDDRLLIDEIEVTLHAKGQEPRRFYRDGPHWLGLICGMVLELTLA